MHKILVSAVVILFCATGANAKSLKFTDQETAQHGGSACLAEIERAAQSAKDAAPFDTNGNPRTPTGKYKPHDHSKCEDWDDYVKQKYPNPSGN